MVGQPLNNQSPDVFKRRQIWRPYRSGQQSSTLCIVLGQNRTCNMLSCIIVVKEHVCKSSRKENIQWMQDVKNALKLRSIWTRDAWYSTATETITPREGLLYQNLMQAGDVQSPWRLLIDIWPSDYGTQNRNEKY